MATRLMRVTGDCFRAARVLRRFAADFRVALDRVVGFVELLRFGPRDVFVALFAPADVRFDFDAAVVFRRALLPDDFDAVAIGRFLGEGTKRPSARFGHSIERIDSAVSVRMRDDQASVAPKCSPIRFRPTRRITVSLRIATSGGRRRRGVRRSASVRMGTSPELEQAVVAGRAGETSATEKTAQNRKQTVSAATPEN